jgi:surfactin synthase thioesterase subunit
MAETGSTMRLFCLPYAGGWAARAFQPWRPFLRRGIELCFVEMPRRGGRLGDPDALTVREAIDDVATRIAAHAGGGPYAVYGHSLGGLVAYETLHRLAELGHPGPRHLFVSASRPPQLRRDHPDIHTLPDRPLLEALAVLGGVPEELLDNAMAVAFFAPMIRSDYRIYEQYRYAAERAPLACPITAVVGTEDPVTSPREAERWGELTTGSAAIMTLEGTGHFFLEERAAEIVARLNTVLAPSSGAPAGR